MKCSCLLILGILCGIIAGPTDTEACGWWGDGGAGDSSDPVLVDSGEGPAPGEQGSIDDPRIQTRLGNSYRSDGNYKDAMYWYRKAAEQKFAAAQNNLAAMYEQGLGVPKDDEEAVKWYRRAAGADDARAQHSLGIMYRDGRGIARDPLQAAQWIRKSAEQGHPGAFRDMGELYWKGLGVSQDNVLACMWWELGALHGDRDSDRMLGMAVAEMALASVQEAKKLAQEWMEKNK